MNETMIQEWALQLNEEERLLLLNVLELSLKDSLVEEHRTDAFEYSDYLRHKQIVFRSLIEKLKQL